MALGVLYLDINYSVINTALYPYLGKLGEGGKVQSGVKCGLSCIHCKAEIPTVCLPSLILLPTAIMPATPEKHPPGDSGWWIGHRSRVWPLSVCLSVRRIRCHHGGTGHSQTMPRVCGQSHPRDRLCILLPFLWSSTGFILEALKVRVQSSKMLIRINIYFAFKLKKKRDLSFTAKSLILGIPVIL